MTKFEVLELSSQVGKFFLAGTIIILLFLILKELQGLKICI